MRIAKATGHVAWWVFVVARLMSELGSPVNGSPRRYANYPMDSGWTAYAPLTDLSSSSGRDMFVTSNVLSTIAIAALVVTVVAAIVVALKDHRLWPGLATVAAPVVGGVVVLWSLEQRGFVDGGRDLPLLVVFVLVLLGIAIRELGSRPRVTRAASTPGREQGT